MPCYSGGITYRFTAMSLASWLQGNSPKPVTKSKESDFEDSEAKIVGTPTQTKFTKNLTMASFAARMTAHYSTMPVKLNFVDTSYLNHFYVLCELHFKHLFPTSGEQNDRNLNTYHCTRYI